MKLYKLLSDSSFTLRSKYLESNVNYGKNYFYNHSRTIIEPLSEVLILLLNINLLKSVKIDNLIGNLFIDKFRPYKFTFKCRDEVDRPNGVIGQSKVIKALAEAGEVLNRDDCKTLAEELFFVHPFDEKEGLWYRIDIDGKNLGKDYTLNHQICFAAYSLSLLPFASKEVKRRLDIFMDKLDSNMSIRSNGQIVHPVRPKNLFNKAKYGLINTYNYFFYKKGHYQTKEPGYQGLNMMLLSLLYKEYKNHKFFKTKKFKKALKYFTSKEYEKLIADKSEPYFFTHVKVQLAITLETFYPKQEERIKRLLTEFITEYYDFNDNMLGKNSNLGKATMAPTIYLLSFLEKDYELDINV